MAKRPPSRTGSANPSGERRRPAGRGSGARPGPLEKPASRAGPQSVPENLVLIGEFGRAHGLRGEVRVKSYTGDPKAIAAYGPVILEGGRRLLLTHARPAPGGAPDLLIVRAEGVETREAAEALNRTRILIERERLPPPEDEDEFLLADLVGLPAYSPKGDLVGTVIDVPNYGGGDLLELRPPKGPSALLPFTRVFVPEIDIQGRRIVVDLPADLFERGRPEPGEDVG